MRAAWRGDEVAGFAGEVDPPPPGAALAFAARGLARPQPARQDRDRAGPVHVLRGAQRLLGLEDGDVRRAGAALDQLGDPARRRLACILARVGVRGLAELCRLAGGSRANTWAGLRALGRAGVVTHDGGRYRVSAESFRQVARYFDLLATVQAYADPADRHEP